MKTNEMVGALKANQDLELKFSFADGSQVPEGYHITEVKNLRIESVDCGGATDAWKETVIQVWVPSAIDPEHQMPTGKALKIIEKAHSLCPMSLEAECFIEVEEEVGTAVIYRLSQMESTNNSLIFHLESRKAQCKANLRVPEQQAVGCCGAGKKCG
jgi:hypothetical protein